MTYIFLDDRQYIMPTHFGPMSGPRHSPSGGVFPQPDDRDLEIVNVLFETDANNIEQLLPPQFELLEPTVNMTMVFMRKIAWLAGRGYNTLGVTALVKYVGDDDIAEGPLQLVLWENLTEAILTGREQLGFSKIYCDLPDIRFADKTAFCSAHWQGHKFFELIISDLSDAAIAAPPAIPSDEIMRGILNVRYIPDVENSSRPHLVETTLTPFLSNTPNIVSETKSGKADLRFFETSWMDMPTQYHIVEKLRALPIIGQPEATYVRGRGACDARNQRVVR